MSSCEATQAPPKGLSHEQNWQYYMNATQGRSNCRLPNELPFQGRDFVPTTTVPMPGKAGGCAGWAEVVDLESEMRSFENRDNMGGCLDLRGLQIPIAWQFNYLPHGWQQPDDFSRHHEYSRMMIGDTCRPQPSDCIGFYDTRNCASNITDCNPQYPPSAVFQHRLVFP